MTLITEKGLSPRRLRDIRAVLNRILEDAYYDEIIEKNPFNRVVRLPKKKTAEFFPFSTDEINSIRSHAQGQFRNMFALGFFTGMRTGEIIGLRWEDVNFKELTIKVERAIRQGIVSTPKTVGSIRTIEILDTLTHFLQAQYKLTVKQNSYVFLNQENTHFFDSDKIRGNYWKKTLERVNVEYRTFYQMRHIFASIMVSNGEDILWVSNMLGHTTPEMTLKKYTRYVPKKKTIRASFLNEKISA